MSEKIRTAAFVFLCIEMAAVVTLFIVAISEEAIMFAGVGIGCALVTWLQYVLLCGFAEVIDNTAESRDYMKHLFELQREEQKSKGEQTVSNDRMVQSGETAEVAPYAGRHRRTIDAEKDENSVRAVPIAVGSEEKVFVGGEKERCTACGTIQRAGRSVCWNCGVQFERQHSDYFD